MIFVLDFFFLFVLYKCVVICKHNSRIPLVNTTRAEHLAACVIKWFHKNLHKL